MLDVVTGLTSEMFHYTMLLTFGICFETPDNHQTSLSTSNIKGIPSISILKFTSRLPRFKISSTTSGSLLCYSKRSDGFSPHRVLAFTSRLSHFKICRATSVSSWVHANKRGVLSPRPWSLLELTSALSRFKISSATCVCSLRHARIRAASFWKFVTLPFAPFRKRQRRLSRLPLSAFSIKFWLSRVRHLQVNLWMRGQEQSDFYNILCHAHPRRLASRFQVPHYDTMKT